MSYVIRLAFVPKKRAFVFLTRSLPGANAHFVRGNRSKRRRSAKGSFGKRRRTKKRQRRKPSWRKSDRSAVVS